jgi:hypothetical protein
MRTSSASFDADQYSAGPAADHRQIVFRLVPAEEPMTAILPLPLVSGAGTTLFFREEP